MLKNAPFYRRHPIICLTILAAFAATQLNRDAIQAPVAGGQGTDHDRYHEKTFAVTRVVDGDTLDIEAPDQRKPATRIRLWGVDTPEVAGSPRGDMHWGSQASQFAKETLTGRQVRLSLLDRTRDRYGRLLAYVYLADTGEMFNEMLVTKGHAYADVRFDHPQLSEFVQQESAARAARKGLWADITPQGMPTWRRKLER